MRIGGGEKCGGRLGAWREEFQATALRVSAIGTQSDALTKAQRHASIGKYYRST